MNLGAKKGESADKIVKEEIVIFKKTEDTEVDPNACPEQ